MEKVFLDTFQHLLHPGWRFLARNWGDGIEATLTARATLDLGSSRFRNEVVGGLKNLLRERITWSGTTAYGHDGCTLCTARLLYIFASARQLFPPAEFSRFAIDKRGKNLSDAVRAMLLHFLYLRPEDPAWAGVRSEEGREERIQSPDYAAWAAWAITYCLVVDREIHAKTGEEWLVDTCQVSQTEVHRLARERWDRLLAVSSVDLLSARVEEPHSFTLGQVAASFLNLSQVPEDLRKSLIPSERRLRHLGKEIAEAYGSLTARPLAQLSLFYLLPATVFLDNLFPGPEQEDAIVRTCHEFLRSPIWIRKGPDAGSWGFNVKNTSTLLTSLVSFWRYAFEGDSGANRGRFEDAFSRYKKP